jgi:hypothetical protein
MNDWPADPRLDESLRRLVDSELADAQIDGAQLIAARNAAPARSLVHSAPTLFGLAGVGLAAVVVIVAALALRGTIRTAGGGPGAGGEAGPSDEPTASASIAAASTSPELTAQPSTTTSGVPVAGAGRWATTGSPSAATTSFNSALRLTDGRVLFIEFPSSEIYDPATGKFTATGSMSAARYGHTATLLTDGRVLIASGNNGTTGETSIEIYDPATGRFGDAGSSGNRGFYLVAPLQSGRLLFIGGFDLANITKDAGSFPNTCDLYDPATQKVSPAASLRSGQYAAAIALLDGRVLVAGSGWAQIYTP